MALGQRFGLRTVAVQPVYTMRPTERARLRLLRAIDLNCPLADLPPAAMPDAPTRRAMTLWICIGFPRPNSASVSPSSPRRWRISAKSPDDAEPALPDSRPVWPRPALPPDMAVDTPVEEALSRLASAGLARRYASRGAPSCVSSRDHFSSGTGTVGHQRAWVCAALPGGGGHRALRPATGDPGQHPRQCRQLAGRLLHRHHHRRSHRARSALRAFSEPGPHHPARHRPGFLQPTPRRGAQLCPRYLWRRPCRPGRDHQHHASQIGRARDGQGLRSRRRRNQQADPPAARRLASGPAPARQTQAGRHSGAGRRSHGSARC